MLSLSLHSFIRNPALGQKERREYINFLTLVKRWLALLTDFSSDFFQEKEALAWPNSEVFSPPVIPLALTIHCSVRVFFFLVVFKKETKRKRKYINPSHSQGQTQKAEAFPNSPELSLFKLLLSRGSGKWRHRFRRNV